MPTLLTRPLIILGSTPVELQVKYLQKNIKQNFLIFVQLSENKISSIIFLGFWVKSSNFHVNWPIMRCVMRSLVHLIIYLTQLHDNRLFQAGTFCICSNLMQFFFLLTQLIGLFMYLHSQTQKKNV